MRDRMPAREARRRAIRIILEAAGSTLQTRVDVAGATPGQLAQLIAELDIIKDDLKKLYKQKGVGYVR